ncbi:NUDIX hydrolase [Dactylosporangium sp. NPDC048998]|uniref:NUDIX hydrolase n=1 Tax=Dactylosporangium sp. NPDC048998 TaxID=3363976 RepID=UPI00371BAF4D
MSLLRSKLEGNLSAFPPVAAPPSNEHRRAAVAICVIDAKEPHVLLIKRAARGQNAGQWALPGGRVEPNETHIEAALRETEEEIGLYGDLDSALGTLDDFVFHSGPGFVITPVVLFFSNADRVRRSTAEVHSVHRISLERLTSPEL